MVTSIGATTKRSKLLKKAANCRSRGPPEDSLGARTIAIRVSCLASGLPPHSRTRPYFRILPAHQDKEAPMGDPNTASVPNRPSCNRYRQAPKATAAVIDEHLRSANRLARPCAPIVQIYTVTYGGPRQRQTLGDHRSTEVAASEPDEPGHGEHRGHANQPYQGLSGYLAAREFGDVSERREV